MISGKDILACVDATTQPELSRQFCEYLTSMRASRPSAELAHTLASHGYQLEAAVVSGTAGSTVDLPGSVWHGRRLWAGVDLPEPARAGDVWVDTCQLRIRRGCSVGS